MPTQRIDITTTPIDLATFRTITDSNGQFKTWNDIVDGGNLEIPINYEIIDGSLKGYQEIIGGNITFDNFETKSIQNYRDDLARNNLLTQNKSIMYITNQFMLPIQYSILDRASAKDWSSIVSNAFVQGFLSKKDVENALTIDAMYKYCLATGQFRIIDNANVDQLDANGDINNGAYKTLTVKMKKLLQKQSRTRTKFSKGFSQTMVRWIMGQDLLLNILVAQTGYWIGADKAYEDYKNSRFSKRLAIVLNQEIESSLYLGDLFGMNEFKDASSTTIYNPGSGTGNLVRPFDFTNLVSMFYYPEAIALYQNVIGETKRPMTDSRSDEVYTFIYNQGAAMKSMYKEMNMVFISGLPTIPGYTPFTGSAIPAIDTNTLVGMNALRQQLYNEQPDMYQELATPLTQAEFTAFQNQKIIWKGTPTANLDKKGKNNT